MSTQTECISSLIPRLWSLTPSVRQYRDGSRWGRVSAHMHSSGLASGISRSSLASAFLCTILPCWNLREDCSQTRNAVSQYTLELPVLSVNGCSFASQGTLDSFLETFLVITAGGMLLTSSKRSPWVLLLDILHSAYHRSRPDLTHSPCCPKWHQCLKWRSDLCLLAND